MWTIITAWWQERLLLNGLSRESCLLQTWRRELTGSLFPLVRGDSIASHEAQLLCSQTDCKSAKRRGEPQLTCKHGRRFPSVCVRRVGSSVRKISRLHAWAHFHCWRSQQRFKYFFLLFFHSSLFPPCIKYHRTAGGICEDKWSMNPGSDPPLLGWRRASRSVLGLFED